ncbi:MAG: ferritin [Candidatus Muiribacterium halophilum]|uniref:Ferritin n=1 Tax=Muiribacterium halophilum TaxID=2053465 RepID=A0A2N5ZFN9_MUIH1|nr:MAG: ferritin [Candidatus Muirbacterium halophilum]
MLTKKMEKELNKQINAEFYSSYLYLSMVTYFDSIGLPGFSAWMKAQTQEEIAHGMKIFDHVSERGGRVLLDAIEKPAFKWKSPLDAFKAALDHERLITSKINRLVDIARKEKDHATDNFLQWFISEQVEEETNVGDINDKLKLIGNDKSALFMLDQEMGKRIFTPPADKQ